MNTEMDDAQNDLLRALATQIEEMKTKFSIQERMTTMMFNFLLSELESHNQEIKEEIKQILVNVKDQLHDDAITCAAAEQLEILIG
jgi:hypothetical protein